MDDAPTARSRVTVSTVPLWRIRLERSLPRYLLGAVSLAGVLASARFAIDPPRATSAARAIAAPRPPDLAGQNYAELFARAYLDWDASNPEAHRRALEAFVGSGMEAGAGLDLPPSGEERVLWIDVVGERTIMPGEQTYTLAVQTDSAGLVYLSVAIGHAAQGTLYLEGYPAFVGAPPASSAGAGPRLHEVDEPALQAVVERAIRNYLAASSSELAADLASQARVSLPRQGLSLETVQRLDWSAHGRDSLDVVVQAQDQRGARYTLAYRLDVALVAGRWEVAAIETDSDV